MVFQTLRRILRFIGATPAIETVHWRGSTDYSELSRVLRRCDMGLDEFVAGPIELYLQWIAARPHFRGDQARIMQHLRGSVEEFRNRLTPPEQIAFDRKMKARLGELPENDQWLLAVWNGLVGHHGI